jgi:hypothetical protein
VKAIFALSVLMCLWCLLSGCGEGGRESLTDCKESETGYVIDLENTDVDCERASIILGLIGSAEHGVQKIREASGKSWMCRAFPERARAVKYICRQGKQHFSVRAPD